MKTILFTLCFIATFLYKDSYTQEKDTYYDLTISASNPAFSILDLSPSSIERPKDPTDFAVTLQNATDNFSIIPGNFALEVSPWIFKPKVTFDQFNEGSNIGNNFIQTSILSIATSTNEQTDNVNNVTRLAVGYKLSIFRGEIRKSIFSRSDSISDYLELILDKKQNLQEQINDTDKVLDSLKNERRRVDDTPLSSEFTAEVKASLIEVLDKQVENRKAELEKITERELQNLDSDSEEYVRKIKELVSKIEFKRDGGKLDFATAAAFTFNDQDVYNGKLKKYGIWITGGYERASQNSGLSILGTVKTLFTFDTTYIQSKSSGGSNGNADSVKHSISNLDFGGRLIGDFSRFYISGEIVARVQSYQKPNYKYLIDIGYNIGGNKLVVFNFGKDFDGNPYQNGNLIAALNFILGLGAQRPL